MRKKKRSWINLATHTHIYISFKYRYTTLGAKCASLPVDKYKQLTNSLAATTEICHFVKTLNNYTTDDHSADYSRTEEIPALHLWAISIRISLCVSTAL